jgi:hypothetical protein
MKMVREVHSGGEGGVGRVTGTVVEGIEGAVAHETAKERARSAGRIGVFIEVLNFYSSFLNYTRPERSLYQVGSGEYSITRP